MERVTRLLEMGRNADAVELYQRVTKFEVNTLHRLINTLQAQDVGMHGVNDDQLRRATRTWATRMAFGHDEFVDRMAVGNVTLDQLEEWENVLIGGDFLQRAEHWESLNQALHDDMEADRSGIEYIARQVDMMDIEADDDELGNWEEQ